MSRYGVDGDTVQAKSQAVSSLALSRSWRRRMGVEPTRDSEYCPADGFEDREAHRDPSASRVTRGSSYRLYDLGAAPTISPSSRGGRSPGYGIVTSWFRRGGR